jgi:hypothetical protein
MKAADYTRRLTVRSVLQLKNLVFQDQKYSSLQNFVLILQHLKTSSYVLTWF